MAIEIDAQLGEQEWGEEAKNTDEIVGMIEQSARGQHLSGQRSALRDAHPKVPSRMWLEFG